MQWKRKKGSSKFRVKNWAFAWFLLLLLRMKKRGHKSTKNTSSTICSNPETKINRSSKNSCTQYGDSREYLFEKSVNVWERDSGKNQAIDC